MENTEIKSTIKRRSFIMQQLEEKGQVSVNDLSEMFGVSEVTIRNDLAKLEKKNLLIRARGGAMKLNRAGTDFELSDKQRIHFLEKQRIGKMAASLVNDGDTIILDSGTTTMEVARNLIHVKDLTVITNALNIAIQLAKFKSINVIVPGGMVRNESQSLVGSNSTDSFRNLYCDKLFLGVDGFDTTYGLSTPNVEEAHLNQIMIEVSKQVITTADSTKFRRRSLAHICPVSKVDILVTDSGIERNLHQELEQDGIKVMIA
jgi:DeoR family transcriptional regulator of aga operon